MTYRINRTITDSDFEEFDAIDPVASTQAIENDQQKDVAKQVRDMQAEAVGAA